MGELSYTNIYKANPISEEKIRQIRQFFKADKIKVVIHIGPHKTGTTSIQKGIHDYKEIIARGGYVIPGKGDAPGPQKYNPSHNIAPSLLQKRNDEGVKDREVFKALSAFLQRSKQEKENVLLSSETFDMVDPKLMEMIFDDSFGGLMTLGEGAIIASSTKQKINTKSSTEAEIVGVDDIMNIQIWTRYYLDAQAKHSGSTTSQQRDILHQDNTSSIRLEKNGKASSTKRTRHIDIRYSFVTDRLKASGSRLDIQHCPTEEMSADILTKPLQGNLSREHRDTIMGVSASEFDNYRDSYNTARNARKTPASE